MTHVRYTDRDDMQDETYKTISDLIVSSILSYRNKNAEQLYADLDSIYLMVWSKLDKKDGERIQDLLLRANGLLYGPGADMDEGEMGEHLSRVLDELREVLRLLTGYLVKVGILFKMRTPVGELSMRGGP